MKIKDGLKVIGFVLAFLSLAGFIAQASAADVGLAATNDATSARPIQTTPKKQGYIAHTSYEIVYPPGGGTPIFPSCPAGEEITNTKFGPVKSPVSRQECRSWGCGNCDGFDPPCEARRVICLACVITCQGLGICNCGSLQICMREDTIIDWIDGPATGITGVTCAKPSWINHNATSP